MIDEVYYEDTACGFPGKVLIQFWSDDTMTINDGEDYIALVETYKLYEVLKEHFSK